MKFLHIFIESFVNQVSFYRGSEKQFYQFLFLSKEKNFVAFAKNNHLFERFKPFCQMIPISGFWSLIHLHRLIRKENIQNLIVHDSKSHTYGLVLKFLNKKIRLVVHRRAYRSRRRKKFKFKTPLIDAFISVSYFIRNNLIQAGVHPEKVFVVYDFFLKNRDSFLFDREKKVEREEVEKIDSLLNLKKSGIKICYLAAFDHQKNHAFLIHSLKLLKQKQVSFTCFLAGRGKLEESLKALSVHLNLENEIKFLGHLFFVQHLLKVCDVMVFPAINEALGSSLIEGAFENCLLIGARSGGIPELIIDGKTGLLFDPSSKEDLVKKLIYYSKNLEIKEELTKNALIHIQKNFDPKKQHEKLIKLYGKIERLNSEQAGLLHSKGYL